MSSLLTQCPHCNTSFRVSAAQQNAAGGLVRCGSCLAVFSASDNEIRIKQPAQELLPDSSPEFEELIDFEAAADEPYSPQDLQSIDAQASSAASVMDDDDVIVKEFLHGGTHDSVQEYFAGAETGDTQASVAIPAQAGHDDELDGEELDGEELDGEELDGEEPDGQQLDVRELETSSSPGDDENPISLGDMVLDEDVAVPAEDQYDEPVAVPPSTRERHAGNTSAATQRAKTEEKVQVRKYLSSLADEETTLAPVDETQLEVFDEEPVTFVARKSRSPARTLLFFSLNLLLLAGLAAQWLYWNRLTLEEHPRFAFLAPHVCRVFSCPEPVTTPVISALSSQQLQVRSHPRFPDALEVNFIFNNDSTTSQPFPNLELAFSDLNNQLLTNRMFKPEEYLPPELQQFGKMPPQTSVHVILDLADPGEEAVNYSVTLHEPQGAAE